MQTQRPAREIFHRSLLTLAPEFCLAGVTAVMVGVAGSRSGMGGSLAGAALVWLPVAWAAARVLLWSHHSWTATADGDLILRTGAVFGSRERLALHSLQQVQVEPVPLLGRLGIGHIVCESQGADGNVRHHRWTWMARYLRLAELIAGQGSLPVGRPTPAERVGAAIERVRRLAGVAWAAEQARAHGRLDLAKGSVEDYGRFLAYCQRLLRHRHELARWQRESAPSATTRRWVEVLRRVRVLVSTPDEGGWRVAAHIEHLEDIRRRISPEGLRQAVRESIRS